MNERKVKIRIENESGEVETLWAKPINETEYIIENSPFYAYGISWKDIVQAEKGDDGILEFKSIIKKSNNRTIRVISTQNISSPFIKQVNSLGCTVEGFNSKYIAINIPPSTTFKEVIAFVEKSNYDWEYADPTYEEIHSKANS